MSIRRRDATGDARILVRNHPFSRPSATRPLRDPMLTQAVRGLFLRRPDLSARGPGPRWLLPVATLLFAFFGFAVVLEPLGTWGSFGALLLAPFLVLTTLRSVAAMESLVRPCSVDPRTAPRTADRDLPRYAVLAPMYDEPEVLPSLVAALSALDYPRDRLDLVLVLEAHDRATRAALDHLSLPPNMRVVLVPPGGPKTKPKALNYALATIHSDLVVVFDAEDKPEPGQLRIAAQAFASADASLACVQARLNVFNPGDSFWTRQFALEYSALFDGLLPALERLRLPIPLGGTSNHFRLAALRAIGAWDPYNVTEDADLGIRLARLGYRTTTIPSTTWEEAPVTAKIWLGQRTRWLKGWVQTWLVHMRRPGLLLRELGGWQFLGVQTVMGGVLLSVLVYPVALVAMAMTWALGGFDGLTAGDGHLPLVWRLAVTNLALGILAPMLTAAFAVIRRNRYALLPSVLWMPLYWVLISIAGYRALIDLLRRPFYWEKTRHGLGQPGLQILRAARTAPKTPARAAPGSAPASTPGPGSRRPPPLPLQRRANGGSRTPGPGRPLPTSARDGQSADCALQNPGVRAHHR